MSTLAGSSCCSCCVAAALINSVSSSSITLARELHNGLHRAQLCCIKAASCLTQQGANWRQLEQLLLLPLRSRLLLLQQLLMWLLM
jgi:hypothetical protein